MKNELGGNVMRKSVTLRKIICNYVRDDDYANKRARDMEMCVKT